jgi:transcription elongation factor GreA
MDKEPMTAQGYEKITKELEHLKNVERNAIAEEIATAKEHGDLKENAEYHAAKEKQVHMEKRLALLQEYVGKAQVIDPSTLPHKKVSFGSTVKVLDLESDKELEYTIVGAVESNVEKGLISFNSPLARALLGKEDGMDIMADLPNGMKEFEILEIYYKPIEF